MNKIALSMNESGSQATVRLLVSWAAYMAAVGVMVWAVFPGERGGVLRLPFTELWMLMICVMMASAWAVGVADDRRPGESARRTVFDFARSLQWNGFAIASAGWALQRAAFPAMQPARIPFGWFAMAIAGLVVTVVVLSIVAVSLADDVDEQHETTGQSGMAVAT